MSSNPTRRRTRGESAAPCPRDRRRRLRLRDAAGVWELWIGCAFGAHDPLAHGSVGDGVAPVDQAALKAAVHLLEACLGFSERTRLARVAPERGPRRLEFRDVGADAPV